MHMWCPSCSKICQITCFYRDDPILECGTHIQRPTDEQEEAMVERQLREELEEIMAAHDVTEDEAYDIYIERHSGECFVEDEYYPKPIKPEILAKRAETLKPRWEQDSLDSLPLLYNLEDLYNYFGRT